MRSHRQILFLLTVACLSLAGWVASAHAFGGFVENRGQVDARVKYYAPGSRVSVYFTDDAVVLDLKEEIPGSVTRFPADPRASEPLMAEEESVQGNRRGCAVYIRFESTNPSPVVEAHGEKESRYDYFLGDDPTQWQTGVRAYGEVVYRSLWPGVDLVFREQEGRLTYSASIAPGADGEQIRFEYDGVDGARILEDGSVQMETVVGWLVHVRAVEGVWEGEFHAAPQYWSQGSQSGSPVEDDNPAVLLWSTFLGGGSWDKAHAVCLDASGNAVVIGEASSLNFPATPGAYDTSYSGGYDVFVAKISASGGALLWSTFLGGSASDYGSTICLDTSGNPVVVGYTASPDFPATPETYDGSYNGGSYDIFICKLSSLGSGLLWSTFMGDSSSDYGMALCLDASENPIVTGVTYSPGFPTTSGAYDSSYNGGDDVFVTKLSSSGESLVWSTFVGGGGFDSGKALCLDSSECVVVTGRTYSSDFPATPGAYDETYNGDHGGQPDVFVSKLNSSGSALLWSTFLGGSDNDASSALCLDSLGNPVVTGETKSPEFPTTPGAYDEGLASRDVFLSKLDSSGSTLLWSTFLGGSSSDCAYGFCLDSQGNPVVAGYTQSFDFPTTPGAYSGSYNGVMDVLVSKISSSGDSLLWSTFLGGSDYDWGNAVCLDSQGHPVVAGVTRSSDFPTTPGAYDRSHNGGYDDVFVAKLDLAGVAGVKPRDGEPGSARLCTAYPNPSGASTTVQFYLPEKQRISIALYDVRGEVVRTLVDGITEPGMHQMQWDGRAGSDTEVAPGIYFIRMEAGTYRATTKVVLLR